MANKTVAQLYQENYSTPEIAKILSDQEGLDYGALTQDFDDAQIVNQFSETEEKTFPEVEKLSIGGNELYEMRSDYQMNDADLAKYFSNMLGLDYNALKADNFTDQQIISQATEARDISDAQAFGEGALRGTKIGLGSYIGGALGSPLGPWGVAGGAIVGGIFTDFLDSYFRPETPIQNVPYEMGISGGSTVTIANAPYAILKQLQAEGRDILAEKAISDYAKKFAENGNSLYRSSADKILASAAERPATFLGIETAAGTSATLFGGAAERERPGDVGTRVISETIGGVVGVPATTKVAIPVITKAVDLFNQVTSTGAVKNYRLSAIKNKLVPILEEAGEDPQAILEALKKINSTEFIDEMKEEAAAQGVDLGPRITAVLTQSPTLAKLTAQVNANLGNNATDVQKASASNLLGLQKLIDIMQVTDDPEILSEAGIMQRELFDAINQKTVDDAFAAQLATAQKILTSQGDAIKAGRVLDEAMHIAIKSSRATERVYYNEVDKKAPASADNVISTYDNLVDNELLPESPMPVLIKRFVSRVSGRDQTEGAQDEILADIESELSAAIKQGNKLEAKFNEQKAVGGAEVWDYFYEGIMGTRAQALEPEDIDGAVRDLGNIVNNFRGAGFDQIGSRTMDQTSRRRVAALAETNIKQLLNRQEQQRLTKAKNAHLEQMSDDSDVEGPEIILNDLMKFRTEMLDSAKSAVAAGNFRDARLFNKMAQASLDDLGVRASAIEQRIKAGEEITKNEQALINAYQYSRSLNDVFTRSYAGNIVARKKDGGDRIAPELLSDLINGGSANATNLKLMQITDAAKFAAENAGYDFAETTAANVGTTDAALETILRIGANKLFDPETKNLSTRNLAGFLSQNEESLKLFPALKQDLEKAGTAQRLLEDVQDNQSKLAQGLDDEITYTFWVGASERPEMRLGNAIGDPAKWAAGTGPETPVKNFDALARVATVGAEKYDPKVMRGFKKVILNAASTYAGASDGSLNFSAYKDYFTKPLNGKQGGTNVLSLIQKHGIMSKDEIVNFNRLINEADFIYSKIENGTPLNEVVADAPAEAFDLVLRLGGASFGQRIGNFFGNTNELIAGGAGSRFFRNTFGDMPKTYFDNFVIEAVKDPRAMQMLLDAPSTNINKTMKLQRQMNSWLINSGLSSTATEASEEFNLTAMRAVEAKRRKDAENAALQQQDIEEMQSYLQSVVPAEETNPTLVNPNVAPVQATPPKEPTALSPVPTDKANVSPTNINAMYPTLFPNDPIGNLIAARRSN